MKCGNKFKEPEIKALYDAIAKDKGIGDIDPDIPYRPDSFAKAIQRERRYWGNVLNKKNNG